MGRADVVIKGQGKESCTDRIFLEVDCGDEPANPHVWYNFMEWNTPAPQTHTPINASKTGETWNNSSRSYQCQHLGCDTVL